MGFFSPGRFPNSFFAAGASGFSTNTAPTRRLNSANSQYYIHPDDTALRVTTGSFTQMIWVRMASLPAGNVGIMGRYNTTANKREYGIWTGSGGLPTFSISTNGTAQAVQLQNGRRILPGVPTMLMAERDAAANVARFRVNNASMQSAAFSGASSIFNSDDHFSIGSWDELASTMPSCDFDGAAWWNRVLTESERKWLWNKGQGRVFADIAKGKKSLLTGLVAWWDGLVSSGALLDSSGNNHHLDPSSSVPGGAPGFSVQGITQSIIWDGSSTVNGEGASPVANSVIFKTYEAVGSPSNVNFYNDGTGGDTYLNMIASIPNGINNLETPRGTSRGTNILIAQGGSNDLVTQTVSTTYDRTITYLTDLYNAGWRKIIFVLPQPRTDSTISDRILDYGQMIRDNMAALTALGVVELVDTQADPAFNYNTAFSDTTYYTGDTVHLNNTGHALLASLIAPKLANHLKPKAFDPTDVPNLLAWWSANRNVLNAATNPAVEDDPVATWFDRVNGCTFTQGTNDNRPLLKTNIVNGFPVLRFDGTNDVLAGDSTTLGFTQNKAGVTALLVGSFRAFKAAATSIAVGATTNGGNARFTMGGGANSAGSSSRRAFGRALDADSASEIATSPNLYPTGFEILAMQQDYTNKRGTMFRNGVTILAPTTFGSMTAGNTSNTTSSAFTMGSINGTNPAEYDTAEFLFFDGLVSNAHLAQLAQYFGGVYNIPVSGWTPEVIPNLAVWLTPDAGLTIDTTSGTDTVATWANQATPGSIYNFSQATKANQPQFIPNELNGHPVLRFDGSDDTLLLSSGAGLALARNRAGLTIFVVHKSGSTSGTRNIFSASSGAGAAASRITLRREGQTHRLVVRRLDGDSAATLDGSSLSTTNWILSTVVMDWSQGDGFLFLNGASDASNTSLTTSGNTSDTDSVALAVGAMSNSTGFHQGDIAEIRIYTRALNTVERMLVEHDLNLKYGL